MITVRSKPNDILVELGCGSNPILHPRCQGGKDLCVDVRWCENAQGQPTVDFVADFNEILPISSEEFDGVISQYTIEHISWRKVKQFVSEMFRILKPGGRCVIICPNTEAQFQWYQSNPNGWDNHDAFESASCCLFGDQDYPENTHKSFFSPTIANQLFSAVGFENVKTMAYGSRNTDMVIECSKPTGSKIDTKYVDSEVNPVFVKVVEPAKQKVPSKVYTREEMYDKHYFNGGGKVGGYANEGYRDFPCHEITARHILARKPESVLEVGAARGYVLKRIQDAGVYGKGLEISKHCYMTRVCEGIYLGDLCNTPWISEVCHVIPTGRKIDLCYSIATLEHIPEQFLPAVIAQIADVSKRGLHGVDFGQKDDGWDRTHVTLKSKEWWLNQFGEHAPGYPVEIVDKEELERGAFPEEVLKGDGKVKLNIGSYSVMFHHGWVNIDTHDLAQFAGANGYKYQRLDVRGGLPYGTGSVDMIFHSHMLEHLTYKEGTQFLKECRRVLKPNTGVMRILVPDAGMLTGLYANVNGDCSVSYGLEIFDEINDGCAASPTAVGKLWALMGEGHAACYDAVTLCKMLEDTGFLSMQSQFRKIDDPSPIGEGKNIAFSQLSKEVLEMFPCLSLHVCAVPRTN